MSVREIRNHLLVANIESRGGKIYKWCQAFLDFVNHGGCGGKPFRHQFVNFCSCENLLIVGCIGYEIQSCLGNLLTKRVKGCCKLYRQGM